MPAPLAPVQNPFVTAAYNTQLGLWVATLRAQAYWQYLQSISIVGPTGVGSIFTLYQGGITPSQLVDTTNRGDQNVNQYTPSRPCPPGYPLVGTWTGPSTFAGTVGMTLFIARNPS